MSHPSAVALAAHPRWGQTNLGAKGGWVAPPQGGIEPAAAARAWFWLCLWAASPPTYAPPTVAAASGFSGGGSGTTTTPQVETINGVAYCFRWLPGLARTGPLVPPNPPQYWPSIQVLKYVVAVPGIGPGVGPSLPPFPGLGIMPGLGFGDGT